MTTTPVRQQYKTKQRRITSGMLNFVDVVCTVLAMIILLAYILRRYEAWHYRAINSHCVVSSSFVLTPTTSAQYFPRREAPPLCAVATATTICVGTTPHHGLGLFAKHRMLCGEPVGVALDTNNGTHSNRGMLDDYLPQVTPMASKINHCSSKFNTRIVPERVGVASTTTSSQTSGMLVHSSSKPKLRKNGFTGRWILLATANIAKGQELTIDYNDLPWFLWQPIPWWTCD